MEGDALHYVARVLRLKVGDPVEVFDGAGRAWNGVVDSLSDTAASLRLGAPRELPKSPAITLAQGLAKGDKLDQVVQKSTELGVGRIVPLQLERCIVQLDGKKGADRARRWRKIAEEASRQSGRADVPEVDEPMSLPAFLEVAAGRGERVALLYEEQDESARLGPWLAAHLSEPVALIIGPEGGLSPAEVELARTAGAAILSLGTRILRTETVGPATLSIALHLAGELG